MHQRTVLVISDTVPRLLRSIKYVCTCSFFMARSVCCSIEMEPRTLSQVQLNHAREMAADVVHKTEPNEASATFSEGLKQIDSKRQMEREEGDEETQSKLLILELEEVQASQVFERPPCQCLCTAVSIETPDQEKLKEPLSAPF